MSNNSSTNNASIPPNHSSGTSGSGIDPALDLDRHYIAYLLQNWPSRAFALVAQAAAALESRRESVNETGAVEAFDPSKHPRSGDSHYPGRFSDSSGSGGQAHAASQNRSAAKSSAAATLVAFRQAKQPAPASGRAQPAAPAPAQQQVSDKTLKEAHDLETKLQRKQAELTKTQVTLRQTENSAIDSAARKVLPTQQSKLDDLRRQRHKLQAEYDLLARRFTSLGYDRIPNDERQRWRDQNVKLDWQPNLTENERAHALIRAELADAAYGKKAVGPPWVEAGTWDWRTNEKLPKGFRAKLFRSASGKYILGFAGTDDLHDVAADLQQGCARFTEQYDYAMNLAKQLLKDPNVGDRDPANLEFVGHSLGGGLATAAAVVTGAKANTFNPAGVAEKTVNRVDNVRGLPGSLRDLKPGQVTAYRTPDDALTTWQDSNNPVGRGMPDTVGNKVDLRLPSDWRNVLILPPVRGFLNHRVRKFYSALAPKQPR